MARYLTLAALGLLGCAEAVTGQVTLYVSHSGLSFSADLGTEPTAQTFGVSTTGGRVNFTATPSTSSGGNWLRVSPTSGTTPATVTVSVASAGLSPGTYAGTISVAATAAANSPFTVRVTLRLVPPQALSVSLPYDFTFYVPYTGPPLYEDYFPSCTPTAEIVSVSSTGGSLSFQATATTSQGGDWLSVTPASGTTPAHLRVSVRLGRKNEPPWGSYPGTVTITSANAANSPLRIPVLMLITGTMAPIPAVSAVRNAASYVQGPLAPGEIIYLEGVNIGPPILTTQPAGIDRFDTGLAKTRVLMGFGPSTMAAPLVYVSSTKSSAIVPYGIGIFAGLGFAAYVRVQYQCAEPVSRNWYQFSVAESSPGIFTLDSTGRGQAAALNEDYTVNSASNPAPRGSVVMIYATGAGRMNPEVEDGSITPGQPPFSVPVLPVSVSIGGKPAEVLYAGAAPNLVAGVLQVNVRLPQDAAPGPRVPVYLTVGRATSQPDVTLAVE